MNTALYVILFIVRSALATVILVKYGWRAFGMAFVYALMTAISETLEGV